MTKKELKRIAKSIVKYELIIENETDKKKIQQAQNEIIRLTSQVTNLDDMEAIDEMVMDMLKEKNI